MFRAGAGGNYKNRDSRRHGILPEMGQQFVAVHPRHFQVGDHQMAAHFRDNLGGFETIGSKPYAIAGFFKHASHKFSDADRIVRDYHNAVGLYRIDCLCGNVSGSYSFSAGCKYSRSGRRRRKGVALRGIVRNESIQVNEQDQASIRCKRGAGEEFDAPQIIAQVLDNDFVLAQHFFDYYANLLSSYLHDDHMKISVDRYEWRES